MLLADQIIPFLSKLHLPAKLPKGVEVLNPYLDPVALELCRQFYTKYYSDSNPRTMILGINPGRFGGGVTGIPFTDPIRLEKECGIDNTLQKKSELSAEYMYNMIRSFGGPEKFYHSFYIGAVSPLGFTKDGKNFNYYDNPAFAKKITPFIVESLKKQLAFDVRRDVCFCLGEGSNFKFLTKLNSSQHFFEKIVPLAHPRFIMQYRRKKVNEYVKHYLLQFDSAKNG